MKKRAFPFLFAEFFRIFAVLVTLISVLLPLRASGSAALGLSQTSITNAYKGILTLTVTGLDTVGQSVIIEEYLDVDGSGTITTGDLLLRKYTVTDGQVTSIAGQRNLNIPGDDDLLANGQITTHFTYGPNDIIHLIDGVHIFRVSPSGTGFSPVTRSLTVTQQDYAGSGISGQVKGSGVGQAYATVMLLTTGNNGATVALTIADGGGNFSIKAPAGSYQILPSKPGFVYNYGAAPTLAVAAGGFLSGQTQTLTPGSRTISGQVRNATTLAGVPALGFQGQSPTGYSAVTLADASGNFTEDATTEAWQFEGDQNSLATFGLLRVKKTASSGASSITGFNLNFPQATALIYGTVKTPANAALAFAKIAASGQTTNDKAQTVTDANGNYALNALPDTWNYVSDTPAGYIIQQPTVTVTTAGTATLQNLIAYPATTHLVGKIVDGGGNPVGNLGIGVNTPDPANPGGQNLGTSVTADANGNFDLVVFGGMAGSPVAWQAYLQNNGSGPSPYIPGNATYNVVNGVNQTGLTFTVYPASTHLVGKIVDGVGNPVGNLGIGVNTPDPANPGSQNLGTSVTADAGGNFDLVVFGGTAGSPVAWHGYLQNNGSGPSPYISGNPTYNVVNGVNQTGLTFTVYPVTAHLIGKIVDGSGNPVGNLGIGANTPDPANPNGNYLGTNVTADAGGNFDLGVFGGTAVSPVAWNVNLQNNGTGPSPYVSSNPTFNVVNGVNQTGLIFTVYPVTAHLTGRVLDESNNPIPNLNITAISSSNNNLQSNANVDGSGNFDIPVFGGLWNLSLGNINGLAILPRTNYAVTVVDNVSQSNLVFRVHTIPFNTFIKGKLTGTGGAPISGIQVWATTTYNGNSYSSPYNNQVSTDSNGNYSLPVFAATWSVGVDNAGLSAQGYQAVSNQNAVVTGGGTTTVNFVATHGQTYVVTPSAGGNGGISPNTPQNVVSGGFAVFTATPNSGYVVNQWLVDGSVVQAGGGQYTLFNVGASHGVAVTFKTGTVQTYTLNPFTDGNGFIGPNNPQVISSGGSATFTATPNSGYMVNQWRVDASLAQIGGSSYTISNVTTNHNVQVTFAPSSNLTTWRQTYFPGSTSTTGPGADTATPMNDGVNNLIKFAMGMNPTQPGTMPGTAGVSGGNLTFTYTPSAMAVADGVTFTVTYNDTLAGGAWLSDIVNQGTIGSGGTPVTATVLKGSNGHRFLRLQIASP